MHHRTHVAVRSYPSVEDIPAMAEDQCAPFGTLLGVTDGGVEVFSCEYDTIDKNHWPPMSWFENHIDGTYTGFKWQCVELARRYLFINYGVVFDSIPMAYDIFRLQYVRRVRDGHLLKMASYLNGSTKVRPVKGSLLIWKPMGYFKETGHVAVIVAVEDDHVDIVEQNVDDTVWPYGQIYSRRLKASTDAEGNYSIACTFDDTSILGWCIISFDEYHYEDYAKYKITPMQKKAVSLKPEAGKLIWLDPKIEHIRIFVDKYGQGLIQEGLTKDVDAVYYTMTESTEDALRFATAELHKMFLNATDYVLHHEAELGHNFHIPTKLWNRFRKSFYKCRYDTIGGRFDFALNDGKLKVYEYNAESASGLLECAYIQDRWCHFAGIENVGRSPSKGMFEKLVETWKSRKIVGPVHFMCDSDPEERYHAAYMKYIAEAAGLTCKMIVGGVDGVTWTADGHFQDADGVLITNIWKTWSWQTVLNQYNEEDLPLYTGEATDEEKAKARAKHQAPKLAHVLLHPSIRVFEPLWTYICNNKAILPVLWDRHPDHNYLLKSSFELGPDFIANGYVAKPITGRGGQNVQLFKANHSLIDKTVGRWENDQPIYQELCMLPKFEDDFVQVNTWAIDGEYTGTVLRSEKSGIVNYDSAVYPLRIVPDPK